MTIVHELADFDSTTIFSSFSGLVSTSAVSVVDSRATEIVITPSFLSILEGNVFTTVVSLSCRPWGDVEVANIGCDASVATVFPTAIIIPRNSWQAGVAVSFTARDNEIDDGDSRTAFNSSGCVSSGPGQCINVTGSVSVTVLDDDIAGFEVTEPDPGYTTENGTLSSFSVRLTSEPLSSVGLNVSVSAVDEAALVTSSELSWLPSEWFEWRNITVVGLPDGAIDGMKWCSSFQIPYCKEQSTPYCCHQFHIHSVYLQLRREVKSFAQYRL
jgi:hypothetical protein